MKNKSIIFDLDGTLLDTEGGVIEAVKYTVSKLALKPLIELEYKKFIGPPIQESFINFYGFDQSRAQEAAEIFRNYYKHQSLLIATPYEGIYDAMDCLRKNGYQLGVATYKREDYAIKLLKHYDFDKYCPSMHGSDNFNRLRKSDVLRLTMNELESEPNKCYMIGDSLSDEKAADEVGCKFIGVTYGFGFKPQEKYEFQRADKPEDIVKIICNR